MEQITEEQKVMIQELAKGLTLVDHPTPILETPKEYGMDYEDVKFKAEDGIEPAAWFIPAEGSDKLIICNHPATFNRYGFPGHKEPWINFQDVEVKSGKVYKALRGAGYNVLTYDLRNHGESDSSENNVCGMGFLEDLDMVAAMQYVQGHQKLKDMTVGLFNPCAGGGAAMKATTIHPDLVRTSFLDEKIKGYTFFSYDAREALHLPYKEKKIL